MWRTVGYYFSCGKDFLLALRLWTVISIQTFLLWCLDMPVLFPPASLTSLILRISMNAPRSLAPWNPHKLAKS